MYDTVVFDLDGTLLNTLRDLASAGNAVCREFRWPERTAEAYRTLVGHGVENMLRRCCPPWDSFPDRREAAIRRFYDWYGLHSAEETRPYPGLEALVMRLDSTGVKMAVLSNKPEPFPKALTDRFFPGRFALSVGNRVGTPVKPDPALTRRVLTELDAKTGGILFVGDSSVDVLTGHHVGCPVCGVTWGFRSRESLQEAGADVLADTAEELEEVILSGGAFEPQFRETGHAQFPQDAAETGKTQNMREFLP